MKKIFYIVLIVCVIFSFISNFALAQKDNQKNNLQIKEETLTKIKKFVEDSKIPYQTVGKDVWILSYAGKNIKNFKVVLVPVQDLLVYQAVICEAENLKINDELYAKLNELSRRFDRGKFIVTKDKDLIFRIDSYVRTMDLTEFIDDADQAAGASDEAYPELEKFIIKKTKT